MGVGQSKRCLKPETNGWVAYEKETLGDAKSQISGERL
jgi:hypothetical protein